MLDDEYNRQSDQNCANYEFNIYVYSLMPKTALPLMEIA